MECPLQIHCCVPFETTYEACILNALMLYITCFEQFLYISTPGQLLILKHNQPINCQNDVGNYKVSSTMSCAIENQYTVLPFCEVLYIQVDILS